jgi:hypothetical protein
MLWTLAKARPECHVHRARARREEDASGFILGAYTDERVRLAGIRDYMHWTRTHGGWHFGQIIRDGLIADTCASACIVPKEVFVLYQKDE